VKRVAGLILLVIAVEGGGLMAANNLSTEDLAAFVPAEFQGWAVEEDQSFDPETIFKYIDGAGEVYRSYNFRRLFARRMSRQGRPALIVDLFDMGTSADAFGVFSHDVEGEEARIGQGSTYQGGLLSFWKDRYFVSVYAEEETEETRTAVYGLAGKVAAAIPGAGAMPDLVAALPGEGLDPRSVRYFHNHLVLNIHYFISQENILRLDQKTEAVLGLYGEKGSLGRLLVVRYPDAGPAREALSSFRRAYLPEGSGTGAVRTENGKWTTAGRFGEMVTVVFDAPSESEAAALLARTRPPNEPKTGAVGF
jgi:hypothetical protein